MDNSFDSVKFSVRSYLPLIREDFITRIHGLEIYVKEGLAFSCQRDLPLENSEDSDLCFRVTSFNSVSYLFFLYQRSSSFLYTNVDTVSSNLDKVLSVSPSYPVYFFGDFNDWLGFYSKTDRFELYYNFSYLNDLLQMVNFSAWIPDCNFRSPSFLDTCRSSDPNVLDILQLFFFHCEILTMMLS